MSNNLFEYMNIEGKNSLSRILRRSVFASSFILFSMLIACGGSSDGGNGQSVSGLFFVASNPSGGPSTITRINSDFELDGTMNAAGNEGLEIDVDGTLYQAADNVSPGAITSTANFQNQFSRDSILARIGGEGTSQTTLVAPKGIAIVSSAFIVVADFGQGTITSFNIGDSGDVLPQITAPVSGGKPWDVAYDSATDTLFAALTNGTIDAYDNFLSNSLGAEGPTRTIVPTNAEGEKIAVNLHGIVVDSNRLFVSDVGAANAEQGSNFAGDGALFLIDNAATANGDTAVSVAVSGPSTQLGNPVDIILVGNSLYVAEKANDTFLGFTNFTGASGDVAPAIVLPVTKAESVLYVP